MPGASHARTPVLPPADLTPDTEGTLGQTPLLSVLVSSLRRSLTGTLTLTSGGVTHGLQLALGTPVRAFTPEPWARLGEVVVSLGMCSQGDVNAGLEAAQTSGALLGSHLIARRVVSQVDLVAALRAQISTRLVTFANLPDAATFAFYRDQTLLRTPGSGEDTPCDPLAATLAVARGYRAAARLDGTLAKLADTALRLHPRAELMRFAMTGDETLAAERIRREHPTYRALSALVGIAVARPLVYALAVTRHLDLGNGEEPYDASAIDADAMRKRTVQATPGRAIDLPPPGARASASQMSAVRDPIRNRTPSNPTHRAEPHEAFGANGRNVTVPATPHRHPPPIADAISDRPSHTPPPRSITANPRPTPTPPQRSITANPRGVTPPASGGPTPPSAGRLATNVEDRRALILERLTHIDGDLYALLGLDHTASMTDLQGAYLQAAKLFHPDRLPAELADLRGEASSIFAALTRARGTLTDPAKRAEYDRALANGPASDGGEVVRALDALSAFQRAEVLVKRGDFVAAEPLARAAADGDKTQGSYYALLGWIRAMRGEENLLEALALLDEAVRLSPRLDTAYYYRGVVKKRVGRTDALRDFRDASELNPRNIDAAREVRLAGLRAQQEKEPPKGGFARLFSKK